MGHRYGLASAFVGTFLFSMLCFAADTDLPVDQFFSQVFDLVKSFGGIPWTLKIAGVITILISTMKVSFIRPYWDKLGWLKGFSGAILGLIAGALVMMSAGTVTLAGLAAYFFAGAGSVVVHQMLDSLKMAPFIGSGMLSVIEFISGLLKAPAKEEIK